MIYARNMKEKDEGKWCKHFDETNGVSGSMVVPIPENGNAHES